MNESVYISPLGPISLIALNDCLIYCNWISPDCEYKYKKIIGSLGNAPSLPEETEVIEKAVSQIDEYFQGTRKNFSLKLCLSGTPFQLKVWKEMQNIAFGHIISYSSIAEAIGLPRSARAVARACGANPIAIINPCHRVIATNGKTGGYTGGVDKKLALLNHEKTFLDDIL